ncbi:MAG: multidrug ABC transporter ATP-binding protein, partial [Paracoccaceae bacterium]|nr:multidrug ABC transporter ATP-binding protein [Paracoccaceae bacterium]
IAKALAHEPRILFLDEPTAGVDVSLRKTMWDLVRRLRDDGVTIILTTHYIEEAEEMADRIGVINKGRLMLVEEKTKLIHQLGRKSLRLTLYAPLSEPPLSVQDRYVRLEEDGHVLTFEYDTNAERTGIAHLLGDLSKEGIHVKDVETRQSSLEEIFLDLVQGDAA